MCSLATWNYQLHNKTSGLCCSCLWYTTYKRSAILMNELKTQFYAIKGIWKVDIIFVLIYLCHLIRLLWRHNPWNRWNNLNVSSKNWTGILTLEKNHIWIEGLWGKRLTRYQGLCLSTLAKTNSIGSVKQPRLMTVF